MKKIKFEKYMKLGELVTYIQNKNIDYYIYGDTLGNKFLAVKENKISFISKNGTPFHRSLLFKVEVELEFDVNTEFSDLILITSKGIKHYEDLRVFDVLNEKFNKLFTYVDDEMIELLDFSNENIKRIELKKLSVTNND